MSVKEAALRIIEQLPEDASRDDLMEALSARLRPDVEIRVTDAPTAGPDGDAGASDIDAVTYHLEREGWATVLVPDRPVPPITAEMVDELIEEMRREREDRCLGLIEDDGE